MAKHQAASRRSFREGAAALGAAALIPDAGPGTAPAARRPRSTPGDGRGRQGAPARADTGRPSGAPHPGG